MRVGYVRVSTVDQNTVRQLDGIEVERVFTEKASAKDTTRPKLDEMIAFVRDGDTVIVHSMDRLARNLDDLRRLVRTLTGKGVRVEFVKEGLAFTGEDSRMATLLLSVMGAFAEFERALILERQREGIAVAKQRGVYTGRKPALTAAQQLRERAAAGFRAGYAYPSAGYLLGRMISDTGCPPKSVWRAAVSLATSRPNTMRSIPCPNPERSTRKTYGSFASSGCRERPW
jgi:DNA invertase Pin-like site-specific DNA recombinase